MLNVVNDSFPERVHLRRNSFVYILYITMLSKLSSRSAQIWTRYIFSDLLDHSERVPAAVNKYNSYRLDYYSQNNTKKTKYYLLIIENKMFIELL